MLDEYIKEMQKANIVEAKACSAVTLEEVKHKTYLITEIIN